MVQSEGDTLNAVFAALADPTRRQVLQALEEGERTVSELAQPHGMSLTGFMKHLRVLEDAGLIVRNKAGRTVQCALSAEPMQGAAMWLSRYEKFWSARLDALARYLYHQEQTEWRQHHSEPPANAPHSPSSGASTPRPKKSGARGPTRKR